MSVLDSSTLVIVIGVVSIIALVLMIEVRRVNRNIAGPSWWVGACASYVVAFLFGAPTFSALGWTPGYGVVINNSFGVLGNLLILQGVLRFRGFRSLPRVWPAIFLLFVMAIILLRDELIWRYAVLDPALILLNTSSAIIVVLKIEPEERAVHSLVACFHLLHAATSAIRLSVLMGWENIDIITPVMAQHFVLIATIGKLMGWSYGVGLACNLRVQHSLQRQAREDMLTSLSNRRYFEEVVQQEIARSSRTGARLAICMIDLNGFKRINDTHGHKTGDVVLMEVARRLTVAARSTDFLARLGGDEFAVLVRDISNPEDANRMADRLQDCINGDHVYNGKHIPICASIGLATCPEDGRSYSELLHIADGRMYENKRSSARAFAIG